MKYIFAFLLLFNFYSSAAHATQYLHGESAQGVCLKGFLKERSEFQLPSLNVWEEVQEEKCGLKNILGCGSCLHYSDQHFMLIGDCEDKQMQEAFFVEIKSSERMLFGQGPQNVHVIPGRKNRNIPIEYDKNIYKLRKRIEIFFGKLKKNKRVAMRFEKLDETLLGPIALASLKIILNSIIS
jgi:hypothetical protein